MKSWWVILQILLAVVCPQSWAQLLDEPKVATIGKDEIRKSIGENRSMFEDCYLTAKKKNPKIIGELDLKWTIVAEGKADKVSILKSDLNNPQLEACMVSAVSQVIFPTPPNKEVVDVTYPFVFTAD